MRRARRLVLIAGAAGALAAPAWAGPVPHLAAGPPPALQVSTFGPGANPRYAEWLAPAFGAGQPSGGNVITVNDAKALQPIWGVGGAMTNSSSYLLEHGLSPAGRDTAIANLFGAHHAHLSFIRLTLGGSDFNTGGIRYSEDDMPPGDADPGLKHFNLRHDRDTIAVLREALKVDPQLRILASPWSAPGWMKTNDSLQDAGFKGRLLTRYYAVYAAYFVKFIQGFARAGIPIWAITPQNEPINVPATYEGMLLPAVSEARFIRDYLRPALHRAHLHTYIFGGDVSWHAASYAHTVQRLGGGLAGIAWHCYNGDAVTAMPQFSISQVMSECAPNLIGDSVSALLDDVFDEGARAGVLWSLAEDPSGGPVVPPNQTCHGCRGIITIDPVAHTVQYSGQYFQLEQFGTFLREGAVRIAATQLGHFLGVSGTDHATASLHDAAFRNRDGSERVVVFNNTSAVRTFTLAWHGLTYSARIPAAWSVSVSWRARAG